MHSHLRRKILACTLVDLQSNLSKITRPSHKSFFIFFNGLNFLYSSVAHHELIFLSSHYIKYKSFISEYAKTYRFKSFSDLVFPFRFFLAFLLDSCYYQSRLLVLDRPRPSYINSLIPYDLKHSNTLSISSSLIQFLTFLIDSLLSSKSFIDWFCVFLVAIVVLPFAPIFFIKKSISFIYINDLHYSSFLSFKFIRSLAYCFRIPIVLTQHGGHYNFCEYNLFSSFDDLYSDYKFALIGSDVSNIPNFLCEVPIDYCEFFANSVTKASRTSLSSLDFLFVLQGVAKMSGYLIDLIDTFSYDEYLHEIYSAILALVKLGFSVGIKLSTDRGWTTIDKFFTIPGLTIIPYNPRLDSYELSDCVIIHTYNSTGILQSFKNKESFLYVQFEEYFKPHPCDNFMQLLLSHNFCFNDYGSLVAFLSFKLEQGFDTFAIKKSLIANSNKFYESMSYRSCLKFVFTRSPSI